MRTAAEVDQGESAAEAAKSSTVADPQHFRKTLSSIQWTDFSSIILAIIYLTDRARYDKALQFRFKVTHEDEIFLEEGEHKFHQAHVIAEHIMKLLFTV